MHDPAIRQGARSRRRVDALLALVSIAVIGLLTACTGSGADSGTSSAGGPVPAVGGAPAEGSAGADDAAPDAAAPGVASRDAAAEVAAATQPRRIRRGEVTIEVKDLSRAAAQVRDSTAALRGYVSDESIGLGTPAHAEDGVQPGSPSPDLPTRESQPALQPSYGPGEARLVVRVPSASMTDAMEAFAGLGKELNRWSTETEVEGALVDLESRVATQTASVDRVRALMASATSLTDVVTLESELARREADLESLKAQLQALSGQAAMATVTVVLRTADAAAAAGPSGFLSGLRAGWEALGDSTAVLLTAMGAVVPFVVVAGLVVVPLVMWRRRRRQRPALPAEG